MRYSYPFALLVRTGLLLLVLVGVAAALVSHQPIYWVAGLLLTAWLLGRGDARTPLVATATATLLLADAWFDVVTAGDDVVFSLLMAGLEVPLALACLSVAVPRPVPVHV